MPKQDLKCCGRVAELPAQASYDQMKYQTGEHSGADPSALAISALILVLFLQ
jgi:hypothetical protein